jgi:hypothetical protein
MLGNLIDLDVGVDADIAPHADDRLDHFVILRLEAPRRLDRELDRLVLGISAGGEELGGQCRIERHFDRRIEGRIFRPLKRVDDNAVAAQ